MIKKVLNTLNAGGYSTQKPQPVGQRIINTFVLGQMKKSLLLDAQTQRVYLLCVFHGQLILSYYTANFTVVKHDISFENRFSATYNISYI